MITRDQADKIRDELLSVLAEDAHNTHRLTTQLDLITRESGVGVMLISEDLDEISCECDTSIPSHIREKEETHGVLTAACS